MFKRSVGLFVFVVGTACSTTPTGRHQLHLIPEPQMAAMGRESFNEMKKTKTIETNPAIQKRVECIARALTAQLDGDQGGWETVVFREKTINAFALPGKKIGVFTGLIEISESSDQLAAVIGHEVGHVIAHHGNERVSQAFLIQGGLMAAQIAAGQKDSKDRPLLWAALGVGLQFGVVLPFSREHESEADIIGIRLMSSAGFDPRAAASFWHNMIKATQGQPPEFLSTHPSHETRIRQLNREAPKVLPAYERMVANGSLPSCG